MAKLTLNTGDVLHIGLRKVIGGAIQITCANTSKELNDDPWLLATITRDGMLQLACLLDGEFEDTLQLDECGAIKIEK